MTALSLRLLLAAAGGLAFANPANADVFMASANNASGIQSDVDAFRGAFGGTNNGNTPGSQTTGRREINWDGGGAAANASTPANPFLTFVNRGNISTTPGTGLQQSGQPSPLFADINSTYLR